MKRIGMAVLAACIGVSAAAASVPDVPSPSAHKTPAKGPLKAPRRPSPAAPKPKIPALSSTTRAQFDELMTRGNQSFDKRDWAGAIEAYSQAIALDPTSASAHYNLGNANYWGVVDWAKAEAEYRIAVNLDPNNKYYKDGLDTVVRRQAEDAVAKVRNQQYADQMNAINNEGVAAYNAQQYERAEALFARALNLDPSNAQIRTNLANARQAIAAAEQRRQQELQFAQQRAQAEARRQAQAQQQAQRSRNNEVFNNLVQGLALGQQIAQANRPPPRPAPPPPQAAYSSAPRQYATTTPQTRAPAQSAPAQDWVANHNPAPGTCITLEKNSGGSFWSVVNRCPAAVIGDVCFVNDKTFNCGTQIPAGFGPIRSGGKESIYGPSLQATAWRAKACYYDDWNKGGCRFN